MEFDYIIVGAGSAGCVLADKLSASGRDTVLVVEAGGSDARFWIKVPLGYAFTYADPKVNWCYHTQADAGLKSRVGYWPRGRVIGGSSSINAMAYVRGQAHDFEDWQAAGATGWGWDAVHQAYQQLEKTVHVGDLTDEMHPFSKTFLDAARDLKWPVLDDLNAGQSEGLSFYRSTVRNGMRFSAADAFLKPAMKRANLKVQRNALVERLRMENGRVTGVDLQVGGQTFVAKARREVVVSAGAVNSPQLLQLSGLGPAQLLKDHGIKVKADLPNVGRNMQDHLACTHHYDATVPTLNNRLGRRSGQLWAGMKYLMLRKGPLSVPVNQVGGFVRSEQGRNAPDMQVFCNPASYETTNKGEARIGPKPGFILSVQPCRPTSLGEISIGSADPKDAPVIQPNSLSTQEDKAAAIRAGRVLQTLAQSASIAKVTKAARDVDITTLNDAGLLENFRNRAATVFHPCGTVRMGRDKTDSVLDARLRVHGVGGLRVVDASAFPNITSGNTNAPTMMLAYRAAEMILQDGRSA